ncbi:MAG TPA: methyltransferase [Gemmatimonadaceae bacterium]|nr:methyltransferase [Gemmatimonadaceae bacterium]
MVGASRRGVEPEFDTVGEDYEDELRAGLATTGETSAYFARERMRWLAGRLAQLGHSPRTVLDYGCGRGTLTPLWFELLASVERTLGVDVSRRMLESADAHFGSTRSAFAAIDAASPDHSFDLAYVNGVFHHIPPNERRDAAAYVRDSLRPGGLFAFWENNPWNPGTRYVMSRISFDRGAVTISAPEARRLLQLAGFEVLGTDFLFIFPHFLRALRPIEPLLARAPLGGQYLVLARRPVAGGLSALNA